ncbi:hypothetical protein [Blastopirellula marina]|uniref:Uncharacterized protein n=1 Tax=Blastopirellula marina TaxID=124 RepID=A0A2S8F6D7_9BACT|nr:hypothetical protein [Blastopirellula marina]PQO27721.1 hypothetical protein C5Y98_26855 [Blastopirellula marina]PTL41460.1 hypothetical protein C5Y97_26870 [Blastopirellula marina]
MINPYESTTAVAAAERNPESARARARWLGVTAMVCGFGFIPLAMIAFHLSMGPYYGQDAPRWFEYGQFLILLLPVAAEILAGLTFSSAETSRKARRIPLVTT